MNDPWNTTIKELTEWAYNPNCVWPTQDFDLSIGDLCYSEVILKFAADDLCPTQDFFLSCAYLIIGDAVRSKYNTAKESDIENFLNDAEKTHNKHLLVLSNHAKKLIQNPSSFDYDKWCMGELAKESINK